jgi:molybdopterin converting factor small subunit
MAMPLKVEGDRCGGSEHRRYMGVTHNARIRGWRQDGAASRVTGRAALAAPAGAASAPVARTPRLNAGRGAAIFRVVNSSTMTAAAAITVHVPGMLRGDCGGAAALSLAAPTVRAALGEIERRHPLLYRDVCDETGAVRRHVGLFVNSSHIRDCDGLDTPLAQGDVVTILPAVSGG